MSKSNLIIKKPNYNYYFTGTYYKTLMKLDKLSNFKTLTGNLREKNALT